VSDHDVTLADFVNTLLSDPWFWYQCLAAVVISTVACWLLRRFAGYLGSTVRVVLAAVSPIALLIVVLATFGATLGHLEAIIPYFAAPGGLLTLAGLFAFGLIASLLTARLLPSPPLGSVDARNFE
jgi:Kef-type K+ transport system membrane component KefB